jgi:hypothetical protein
LLCRSRLKYHWSCQLITLDVVAVMNDMFIDHGHIPGQRKITVTYARTCTPATSTRFTAHVSHSTIRSSDAHAHGRPGTHLHVNAYCTSYLQLQMHQSHLLSSSYLYVLLNYDFPCHRLQDDDDKESCLSTYILLIVQIHRTAKKAGRPMMYGTIDISLSIPNSI